MGQPCMCVSGLWACLACTSRVRIQTLCFAACGLPSGHVCLPRLCAPVRHCPGGGQLRAPVQPPAGRG
eukprot:11647057-Alexandrium_andersonii.AAC.1